MSLTQIIDLRPEKNFSGAEPYTDIYFQILDNDGVDIDTLTVRVNGDLALVNGVFQLGFSGTITKADPPGTDYRINILMITNTNSAQD